MRTAIQESGTGSGGTSGHNPAGLSALDRAAVLYLALPVAIFLVGWFRWWVAVPAVLLLVTGLKALAGDWTGRPAVRLGAMQIGLVVTAALFWTALGGAGHLFFANFDWQTRDAVLRDLVVGHWPVGYGDLGGDPSALRAPLAYYLPAALVGKIVGVRVADTALLAWTAIGVGLFLALAAERVQTFRAAAIMVAVLVLFSGMDLLGTVLRGGFGIAAHIRPVDHLEWWASRFQYSSHTTQLFWVPNHALPGWIAVVLLLRNQDNPAFLRMLPVVTALLLPWSPLTAIGFAPLAAWVWFRGVVRLGPRNVIDPTALAATLLTSVLIGTYLTMGVGNIHSGTTYGSEEPWMFFVPHYLQFVLLEIGILWLLLLIVRRDALLWVAGIILWILPLLSFGPSNDLVMRASIPALLVLALATADVLVAPAEAIRRNVFWPIIVVLALGVPTAATEITRAIVDPAWKPNLEKNLVAASGQSYPSHYVVGLKGGLMQDLMKPVVNLPEFSAGNLESVKREPQ